MINEPPPFGDTFPEIDENVDLPIETDSDFEGGSGSVDKLTMTLAGVVVLFFMGIGYLQAMYEQGHNFGDLRDAFGDKYSEVEEFIENTVSGFEP